MPQVGKKHKLENNEVGYQKQFTYDIDMHTNGINGECIEWCEKNCQYKWGWWFEDDGRRKRSYEILAGSRNFKYG